MATKFTLLSKTISSHFVDDVGVGDVVSYEIDCSPWAYDNADISAATWTLESGSAVISGESVASNVVSATVSFSEESTNLISVLIETAGGIKKKIWITAIAHDENIYTDDYSS